MTNEFQIQFLIFEIQERLFVYFYFSHGSVFISKVLHVLYAQILVFHLKFSPLKVWYQLSSRNPPNNKQTQIFCIQNTALLMTVFSFCNNQAFENYA